MRSISRPVLRTVDSAAATSAVAAPTAERRASSRARDSSTLASPDFTDTCEPSRLARASSVCARVMSRASGTSERAAFRFAAATATAARACITRASKSRGSTRSSRSSRFTAWLSRTSISTTWPDTLALTGAMTPST